MSSVESAIKLQILKHGMHIFVNFKAIDDNLFMSKRSRMKLTNSLRKDNHVMSILDLQQDEDFEKT
jgi:hypothetical protein